MSTQPSQWRVTVAQRRSLLFLQVKSVIVVEFGEELVKAIVGIFGEAETVNAGDESACGGDGAFGDFATEEEGGSEETDGCGDRGGDEGEVGGVAGLADAFLDDVAFDGCHGIYLGLTMVSIVGVNPCNPVLATVLGCRTFVADLYNFCRSGYNKFNFSDD
jgi:hypothetical protein